MAATKSWISRWCPRTYETTGDDALRLEERLAAATDDDPALREYNAYLAELNEKALGQRSTRNG